jgi:hypothetical protein
MPGPGGTPGGSSAGLFLPGGQSAAAGQLAPIVQPMADQSVNALNSLGGTSPAQFAYPYVQSAFTNTVNNPYQNEAINSSILARGLFQGSQLPMGEAAAGNLFNLADIAGGNAGNVLGIGMNPAYAQAGEVGSRLSPDFERTARTFIGDMFNPYVQNAVGQGNAAGSGLVNAGSGILNTAFDPQRDLYNRTASQLGDQVNAQLARSGLGGSPYGASVAAKSASDFNLDWQDRQLSRMTAGGSAASGLDTAGTNLMLNPSLQATSAAATDLGAASTAGQSAISSLLSPANSRIAAALQGTGAFGDLLRSASGGYSGGQNILGSLVSGQASTGALPYGAYNTVQGNNFGAAQNEIALGNQNYTLPQQTIANLMQYLGLGQSASGLANSIGSTNFNEGMQTAGGIGSLFGQGGNFLTGGKGIGSLFGGGGGSGLGATGDLSGLVADAAPGEIFGGGDAAASLAPFAASL